MRNWDTILDEYVYYANGSSYSNQERFYGFVDEGEDNQNQGADCWEYYLYDSYNIQKVHCILVPQPSFAPNLADDVDPQYMKHSYFDNVDPKYVPTPEFDDGLHFLLI